MEDMSCSQLKERFDSNTPVILIDVREEWEFDEENIGAVNIPLYEIPDRLDDFPEKEEEIVVHCRTGDRSIRAKKLLIQYGYTNVKILEGGMESFLELT